MRSSLALAGLLLLAACQPRPVVPVPPGARVVARYRVLDEYASPEHVGCDQGPAPDFLRASPDACSFTLGGQEFDLVDKCRIDATGGLSEYWRYLSEGAAVQTLAQLQQDSLYFRERGLVHFRVVLAGGGTRVVDGEDTLRIEQHYPAEKLLLAQKKPSVLPGQRLIYQYQ